MVIPSGRRNSAPVPSASGKPLNSTAMVVMMIGRNRSRQAWKMAASGLLRSVRSASSAKSISRIAFFFTAKISRYSTLYPGDVVWLGAEGATPNMRPGDVVEIESSGIGTLRNSVVAEEENGP